MTLVRNEQRLEETLETTILGELEQLNAKVAGIGEAQTYLRVVLTGGVFGDIHHEGKLPLLEATLKLAQAGITALELRTKSLEDDRLRFKTAARTSAVIGGVVGGTTGTIAMLLVELFTRH